MADVTAAEPEASAAPVVGAPADALADRGSGGGRFVALLYPLVTFALLLLVWQFLPTWLEVPTYILPLPSQFFVRLAEAWPEIFQNLLVTSSEILMGFLAATVISIPLGFLVVSAKFIERSVYPLVVFFQLVPKIAIAPLFIVWFGFGPFPKVLFTFLLCFFPTLVASMTGFHALDERVLYLTRSMGASGWQTFRYVRLPSALGHIFAGLKISIVFASTGAIVAEFVGSNAGLGYLLLRGTSFMDMPLIFAILVVLAMVGLVFSYAVELLELLVMPWQRRR